MPCLHAISSLLEKDRRKRIGATGFETFTDNPFFQSIDFQALEKKRIPPVFVPSSEKTNFDATYDLEELLLEEAPLEARARRQKPRVQLKDDATDKEIRVDELHRMIETLFEPFDYTLIEYEASASPEDGDGADLDDSGHNLSAAAALESSPDYVNHESQTKCSVEEPIAPDSPESRSGTPPIGIKASGTHSNHSEYYPAVEQPARTPPPPTHSPTSHPQPSASHPQQAPSLHQRPRGATHQASKSGGVQVVLNETGSWSDLANKNATLPADAAMNPKTGKPNGMLGFLSRKKGRERSPKPQESGVLGKEGARVVVSGGR